MQNVSRTALQSLPLTLFLMVCCAGLVALSAIPSVGVQLGPLVCDSGETMIYETQDWSGPGQSGTSVTYFCESESGRAVAETGRIIFWAAVVYVIAFVAIAWPIMTWIKHRGLRTEQRLDREGIPAEVTILSVEQTRLVVNRMPVLKLKLAVRPGGRAAFETTMRKTTPEIFIPYLKPGKDIVGIVDPQRPDKVILRFDEIARHSLAAETPTAEHEDGLDTLRTLKTMLDEGLIEQSEYDAKKAEIMERM